MWWSNAAKLLPFLLTSSLDTNTVSPPRPQDDTSPTAVAITTTPHTPSDLSRDFFRVFQDLNRPGPIFKQATPTLRFSYVTPTIDGKSTWSTIVNVPEELKPSASGTKKPIGLYLPGLEGYGISAFRNQFDDLADNFELWRLTIQPDDRSPFTEIVQVIAKFVEAVAADADGRPIVLIGESCGGLLAAAVSLRLQREQEKSGKTSSPLLQGLVLVNPATSIEQTNWDTLAPIMASLDTNIGRNALASSDDLNAYEVLGSLLLFFLIPDGDQIRRVLDAILGLPDLDFPLMGPYQIKELMKAAVKGFKGTGEMLPGDMLKHRVNWLAVGAPIVNARLAQLNLQTLVLVGKEDRFIPSAKEANRLVRTMPNCEKLEVPGRGHFVLDEKVNLTEAILFSKIDPMKWKETKKKYDIVLDWKIPGPEKIASAMESSSKPFRIAHSPVFMSTDKNSKRWMGLSKVPKQDGPMLFVANHQFVAADIRIIFAELFEQKGIVARGLAHPVVLMGTQLNELGGRTPGISTSPGGLDGLNTELYEFGAIPVTPKNYYRLMQSGQAALLFPGGVKEILSGRKDYPLFWPTKTDFVRTAARFNATIIPLSAVGMLDSVNVLIESEDVYKIPFVGERIRELSQNVTAARYDREKEEGFTPPISLPTLPARNYFLFGKPISTKDVDPNDKEACARVYRQTEDGVRRGLDDILRARELDPFKDTPRRLVYERLLGKKAPTFPIDELNKN